MHTHHIRSWRPLVIAALAIVLAGLTTPGASASPATPKPATPKPATPKPATPRDRAPRPAHTAPPLPVTFARNDGQAAPGIRYLGTAPGIGVAFTDNAVSLNLSGKPQDTNPAKTAGIAIALRFIGANTHPTVTGADRAGGIVNDFRGADPARWHTNIPTYNQVVYHNLWPGIDAKFSTRNGSLKYSFDVARDADPDNIRLSYAGADRLALDRGGDLAVTAGRTVLHDQAPVSYQNARGGERQIATRYRMLDATTFGFTLAGHTTGPITIDPGLDYSTYVGGTDGGSSNALSVDADSAGNLYLFGSAHTLTFPTTPGAYQTDRRGESDLIVTKLDPTGSHLVYSTLVGGSGVEGPWDGEVAGDGSVYVLGASLSPDFPTTAGAYRRTPWPADSQYVAFKLNPDGSKLTYSTYLIPDFIPGDMAAGDDGSVTIGGNTSSDYAPTTPGAYQTIYPGGTSAGYLVRLNPTGSGLVFATFLGVPVTDQVSFGVGISNIAVDSAGATYIVGETGPGFPITGDTPTTAPESGLVVKFDPSGKKIDYATSFGVADAFNGGINGPIYLTLDKAGNAYLAAFLAPGAVETTPDAYQPQCIAEYCTEIIEYDPTGSVVYATYFNDSTAGLTFPQDVAIDGEGRIYVVGVSTGGLPVTPDAFATTPGDFAVPWYVAVLGRGTLLYCSYFGGTGSTIIDIGGLPVPASIGGIRIARSVSSGTLYLGGSTAAPNFPVTPGAFQTVYPGGFDSAWAAKLTLPDLPPGNTTPANATASPQHT